MGRRFLLITSLWIAGWVAWPGAIALAAEGEGADIEAVIQELRTENPQLSESEARELAALAAQDLREGEGTAARDLAAGMATEQAGILVQRPTGLGASELGGGYTGRGPGSEMTPEEHALAEKMGARVEQLKDEGLSPEEVDKALKEEFKEEFERFGGHEKAWHDVPPGERDEGRLRELYEAGVPGLERAGGLEHKEGLELNYRELPEGRPDLGHEPTSQEREQMERYQEQPTREIEQPTHEAIERPTYEREQLVVREVEIEKPMYEQQHEGEVPKY